MASWVEKSVTIGGTALVAHAGHIAALGGAASLGWGVGLSLPFMYAAQKLRGQAPGRYEKLMLAAAIALPAYFHGGHDHRHPALDWYNDLPAQMQRAYLDPMEARYARLPSDLKNLLDIRAAEEGVPAGLYLLICSGNDPLSLEIARYERQVTENSSPPGP